MNEGRFVSRHGHCTVANAKRSRTHVTWTGMLQRCTNPSTSNYYLYGGRGIAVCPRWQVFENFLADMGERPSGTSLDRYPDTNGNYEPGNCRWATPAEQRANQRKGLVNLLGMRFSRLLVLEFAGRNGQRNSLWRCVCDCGSTAIVTEYRLKNSTTRSCGCLARELASIRVRNLVRTRQRGYRLNLTAEERLARAERMRARHQAKAEGRT